MGYKTSSCDTCNWNGNIRSVASEEVLKIINKFNPKKAFGADDIEVAIVWK